MKKYYIIYAVIGIVFVLCCTVVLVNPYHGHYAPFEEVQMTSAGKILTFGFLMIAAIAAIACIVYHLYKFIRKLWLKAHNRKDNEENIVDIPGIELSKKSFKDIPEFCRLQFRAVGEEFEKIREEEKDKQNRE